MTYDGATFSKCQTSSRTSKGSYIKYDGNLGGGDWQIVVTISNRDAMLLSNRGQRGGGKKGQKAVMLSVWPPIG